MTIAWTEFTPWSALAGGVLIGLASVWLAVVNGRIAGISGIAAGVASQTDRGWRALFLVGLVAAPLLLRLVTGGALGAATSASVAALPGADSVGTLVLAGLFVGVGTRLANGCTSGHGVCGLSRRSPRSLVATATFMAFGFATVLVTRHVLGGGS